MHHTASFRCRSAESLCIEDKGPCECAHVSIICLILGHFLACNGTYTTSTPCVTSYVCLCVCDVHARVHVSWLTSHKKQDQNQAAEGQREGGGEKAAQDSAPNSPHCVMKSCVYMCNVWVCLCGCVRLINRSFVTPLLQPNESTYTHAHTELICSEQQRCRHVHKVTAQLYFSAIRRQLLFRGNLQNKLLCSTWNTWKRNCFGSEITKNWIAGSVSMQNTEVWPQLIVLSQCTQKWALGNKKLVSWLYHLVLLRELIQFVALSPYNAEAWL